MLLFFLAFGALEAGPPSDIITNTGDVTVLAEQIAVATKGSVSTVVAGDAPSGSVVWKMPFDPSDRSPRAFDWSPFLLTEEMVAAIVRITITATGSSIGLEVDGDERAPIIDSDTGKLVQMWFLIPEELQNNALFSGVGVQVGVSCLIRTNSTPYREYERTAVLTVKQQ